MQIGLKYYRILAIVSACIIMIFGISVNMTFSERHDPLSMRIFLSVACLLFLFFTYVSEHFRRNISSYALVIYYLITMQEFYLNYNNNLAIDYFLSSIVTFMCICLAIETLKNVIIYNIVVATGFTIVIGSFADTHEGWAVLLITIYTLNIIMSILLISRHRSEAKLQEKQAELNRFIYRSSHDLRGPVSTILGLVKVAKMQKDPDQQLNFLTMIDSCANRLDNILKSLVDIKSEEINQQQAVEISFEKQVKMIIDQLKKTESLDSVNFKVKVNQERKYIANVRLVNIILKNLMENAVKYNKEMPIEVGVKIEDSSDYINIKIYDTGKGISPEHKQYVFDMFFRGSANSDGLGLGLYLVKNAVEKLRGDITLLSENGTAFLIKLPIAKA